MNLICQDFYDRDRLDKAIDVIRGRGRRVGVAINPDTDPEVLDFLDRVDMVLAMTVWPGFGGQKFIETVVPKIRKLRRMSATIDIEVDGGLNLETVGAATAAGADVIVAGTATFRSNDPAEKIRELRQKGESARG